MTGPLEGKTVEVKYYAKQERGLDIKTDSTPDFCMVFTGPYRAAESSRGGTRPWLIESVYLFDTTQLLEKLQGRKIGTATSVRRELWDEAQIYPKQNNGMLPVTIAQAELIALFQAA